MHIISMLFSPLLFLLSGVPRGVPAAGPVPTYERLDELSGETLTCARCPPGTHMAAHCTASAPTRCEPCRADSFTELWNYLPRCLYCDNFCFENQEVEEECSAVSNRVCRCREGFYLTNDFCVGHSECGPGHGVQTRGTSEMNTVCEKCAEGFFSSSSSALDSCVKHQECPSGQIVLLSGSVYQDTVCGTCADREETLRKLLSGFFSMHKMRVAKMKKFVTRYTHRSEEMKHAGATTVPKHRGPLQHQIKAWLAKAPVEQLKKVPEMLKASQLSSMAERLEKRVREIEQQAPNCSLTLI